jgi:hypothetical protein
MKDITQMGLFVVRNWIELLAGIGIKDIYMEMYRPTKDTTI